MRIYTYRTRVQSLPCLVTQNKSFSIANVVTSCIFAIRLLIDAVGVVLAVIFMLFVQDFETEV